MIKHPFFLHILKKFYIISRGCDVVKRLILGLILLFISYFTIQWAFVYLSKGHDVSYSIKKDSQEFVVHELFKSNQKKDKDNYFIQIDVDGITFEYQIFDNFEKASKIIKDIYYYSDEKQICILPKFRDSQFLFDVMCFDGELFRYYHSMENSNDSLVSFVNSLSEHGYEKVNWSTSNKSMSKKDSVTVYNNLLANHVIGISNYKGTFKITDAGKIEDYSIFPNDVYQRNISAFIKNLYITFDNSSNKFIVIDLLDGTNFEIISNYDFSTSTYILGSVDNSLYLYDENEKNEYEVNLKKKEISVIENEDDSIKVYSNNKWESMSIEQIDKNATFSTIETASYEKDYDLILKDGYEYGYMYYFKKENTIYNVYRSNINDQKNMTYLFSTTDLNRLILLDNTVYYLKNNDLYYYNDKTGNRKVLTNSELEFNKTIKFGVFKKK